MNKKFLIAYLCSEHPIFKDFIERHFRTKEDWEYVTMKTDVHEANIHVHVESDWDDQSFDYVVTAMELLNYLVESIGNISLI